MLEVVPVAASQDLLNSSRVTATIPARWSGWVPLDLTAFPEVRSFRIVLPPGEPAFQLSGLVLGEDRFSWPWAQKAALTLLPRDGAPAVTVSFDPAALLPPALQGRKVRVLDDSGSSVLLQLPQ